MSFTPFVNLQTPQDVLEHIARLCPNERTQVVPLREALDSVLASDVHAVRPLPAFDCAAMDGYAFCAGDCSESFHVVATIYAGDVPIERTFAKGECCKIMTGAPVPKGLDCVIPHEDVTLQNDWVCPMVAIKRGSHIRIAGEEIAQGVLLLQKGTRLNGAAIGLLASQGIAKVQCFVPLRIAVCASGDELCENLGGASAYEVYNSNAPMIVGMLKNAGFEAIDCGMIADKEEVFAAKITELAQSHDCIITTGGASGGERDLLRRTIESLGFTILFHGIDIKPGKPVLLAHKEGKVFLGLPGTPSGAFAALCVVGLPLLRRLCGRNDWLPTKIAIPMAHDRQYKKGKHKIVLGTIENGKFVPLPFALHAFYHTKFWLLLPPTCEQVLAEECVYAYLL